MKKTQTSKKWFSIVLAMWITIVLSLITILILEFIIPFSRNVKWVENWSVAYYSAYAGIEDSLWELSQNNIWYNSSSSFWPSATGSQYVVQSTTSIIPPTWDGNSEYDNDWNRFDPNTPIQLQLISTSIDFNTIATFNFRVPDMNHDWDLTNDGNLPINNDPIINWILSWLDSSLKPVTLNAEDNISNNNYFQKRDINGWSNTPGSLDLGSFWGITLDWDSCSFQDFYDDNCPSSWSWITSKPILKLSIIDNLELTSGKKIPYLEYKINFGLAVPGRYTQIDTAWKSYGYKKSMDIKVPQLSTNQAFDFAVFQ